MATYPLLYCEKHYGQVDRLDIKHESCWFMWTTHLANRQSWLAGKKYRLSRVSPTVTL